MVFLERGYLIQKDFYVVAVELDELPELSPVYPRLLTYRVITYPAFGDAPLSGEFLDRVPNLLVISAREAGIGRRTILSR